MDHLINLKESIHNKLTETVSDIEQSVGLIKRYEVINEKFIEFKFHSEYLPSLIETLKYRLFLGFLLSDICSSLNVYNNAKTLYEEKFAIRNLIVIVNEGFKKIYNFTKANEKGDVILKHRNNSFWIKNIKPIVYNDIIILKENYDEITKQLNDFLDFNFEDIKTTRDLSIHYDKNPIVIHKMMLNLDLEREKEMVLKFMDIINLMYYFTEKLCAEFLEEIDKSEIELQKKNKELTDEIQSLINQK
ncbi:hypothetical protein H1R16_09415 [Marnyiella aurantia]|uniref:Cthe-2314-like HEPN domain-containing protein n=1 Tax=Marnyiella aurantia TaxID=2758037 RepID=A0A7D7QXY8_9FLAO|nr:hypothetical protein [Marnyiella aurantia]MBA5246719.1 hypothetical protein [Marnyiella aurantia]QMS97931.1 hypothetical protein H1R16_09415 [Marnyiella aurantia]